jgi:hypothetical protein
MKMQVFGWMIGALLVASCGRQAVPIPAPTPSPPVRDTRAATYDLQEKCAKDAYSLYKRDWEEATASYTNHYSAKLGKCFFVASVLLLSAKEPSTHKTLVDVLDHREMGLLDKINREVAPYGCEVSGTKCTSVAEWDALTKPYMED